jgi:hypothetical protein
VYSLTLLCRARAIFERYFPRLPGQRDAEIDAAFSKMAEDPDCRRESIAMAREFETSDWEALQ